MSFLSLQAGCPDCPGLGRDLELVSLFRGFWRKTTPTYFGIASWVQGLGFRVLGSVFWDIVIWPSHGVGASIFWVLVRGFNLSYHSKETVLFTIDPHYGNLNKIPSQEPSLPDPLSREPGLSSRPVQVGLGHYLNQNDNSSPD